MRLPGFSAVNSRRCYPGWTGKLFSQGFRKFDGNCIPARLALGAGSRYIRGEPPTQRARPGFFQGASSRHRPIRAGRLSSRPDTRIA